MSDAALPPIAPKVSMKTKLSYGYGSFGKDFSLCLVNTFLFFYLTDVAGVSAAACGIIFLVARVWDTINDPLFGFIVAKFYNKLGYKPWIFVGNVFNAIFMTACFCTHYFEGTTQLVYLTIVYICWGMSYTICDAPFWSLIPNITLDKDEREGLLPYPCFAATIGGYTASGCGLYAVHLFGQGDDGLGYMIYAALGGFVAISSAIVTCKWTEENYKGGSNDEFNLKEAVFIVSHNKQFLIFLSLAFCYVIGTGIYGSLNLYMFKYCLLHNANLFPTLILCASITAVPSLIFFKPLVNFLGRKTIFIVAISAPFVAATLVSLLALGIAVGNMKVLVIISGLFTGFSNALYWLLVMIMVADTVDYGDVNYNIRSECIYYSLHTLLSKCTGAISSAVIGLFLAWVNYVPNVEQTQGTIEGMTALYWISSGLCIVGALIYIFAYKLNGSTLEEIQRVLTRRYMDKVIKKAVNEGEVQQDLDLLKKVSN